jgi:hypothetical protein
MIVARQTEDEKTLHGCVEAGQLNWQNLTRRQRAEAIEQAMAAAR